MDMPNNCVDLSAFKTAPLTPSRIIMYVPQIGKKVVSNFFNNNNASNVHRSVLVAVVVDCRDFTLDSGVPCSKPVKVILNFFGSQILMEKLSRFTIRV
jgi:hypothetical protein